MCLCAFEFKIYLRMDIVLFPLLLSAGCTQSAAVLFRYCGQIVLHFVYPIRKEPVRCFSLFRNIACEVAFRFMADFLERVVRMSTVHGTIFPNTRGIPLSTNFFFIFRIVHIRVIPAIHRQFVHTGHTALPRNRYSYSNHHSDRN